MSEAGLRECLKYSFPPNLLSYCGPAAPKNVYEYRRTGIVDLGLAEDLQQFHTLYVYLSFIAHENGMRDPFDLRVVKAYWLGNRLLKRFDTRRFYYHLRDSLGLKKRLLAGELEALFGKLPSGALPHHAFHVLNVPWRTGHLPIEHTLETMDACRIGWGKVRSRKSVGENRKLILESKPLIYEKGMLKLGRPIEKEIRNNINGNDLIHVEAGDLVTFHWGVVCNKISKREVQSLRYYTQLAINLANAPHPFLA